MTSVLLLGCGGNAGMNYVRCLKLGDPSIQVYGLDTSASAAMASNVDDWSILQIDLTLAQKLSRIKDLIRLWDIDFVHAQPDKEVGFLFWNQVNLPVTIGNYNAWYAFRDKLYCQRLWQSKGMGCEVSNLFLSQSCWDSLLGDNDRVWVRAINGAGSKSALPVKTYRQAENWASYWVEFHNMEYEDFMVSEYLPGPEYAVQIFFVDGEEVQIQARERVEYFFANIMPSGQSSTPSVARTVVDANVEDAAIKAVKAIEFKPHGVYGVDLKTRSNGDIVPTEVNYGRYYTTSNFFAELGMNTPYDELQLFLGKEMPQRFSVIPENYYWMRGLDKLPVIREPNGTIRQTT